MIGQLDKGNELMLEPLKRTVTQLNTMQLFISKAISSTRKYSLPLRYQQVHLTNISNSDSRKLKEGLSSTENQQSQVNGSKATQSDSNIFQLIYGLMVSSYHVLKSDKQIKMLTLLSIQTTGKSSLITQGICGGNRLTSQL